MLLWLASGPRPYIKATLILYDPGALKSFLGRHGISAAKGLGQHFLCSGPIVAKIVESLSDMRGVLEIGPGPGVLTGPISESCDKMIALELDSRMEEALKDSAPKATVLRVDALETDLGAILAELPEPRGVVSNLPYYITGPLLTRIAECRSLFSKAVLMMQKEVAQRVMAPAGNRNRGSLSVFLQSQFDIATIAQAPAGAFMPAPKVDSSVLAFTPADNASCVGEGLFRLARFGFTQPRKTLANNLIAGLHKQREEVETALQSASIPVAARAQDVELEKWCELLGLFS